MGNFALNCPLLITLFQIPPPTLPCALLDQHRVAQIKSFQVCTVIRFSPDTLPFFFLLENKTDVT
jgi:hypothetical protein